MRRRRPKPPPPPKVVRRAEWKARFARLLGLAFCAGGFLAIALGWAGAARRSCVDCQIPYLISGGAAGVALMVLGAGLLVIAQMRTEARRLSARLEQMTWTLAERFMGGAAPAENGASGNSPTTGSQEDQAAPRLIEAAPAKKSAGVAADARTQHMSVVRSERGSEPNPWWER